MEAPTEMIARTPEYRHLAEVGEWEQLRIALRTRRLSVINRKWKKPERLQEEVTA